ncbi:hypothetical protein ACHAWF_008816 [Thalassiosira exigua]
MAPPKPAPIAAARRGKFLSAPSSSPSPSPSSPVTKARGKFLGGTKPGSSPAPLQQTGVAIGSHANNVDNDSLSNVRTHITTSKESASSRCKDISVQRERVTKDLSEAENIVLSLLECASGVAGALSEMTVAKSRNKSGMKGDGVERNEDNPFHRLTETVRSSGIGYIAGVRKLHKLLSPHALLVKKYARRENLNSGKSSEVTPSAAEKSKIVSNSIMEEATSNMYAARVKKRLAMEQKEILTEMIRLEEMQASTNGTRGRPSCLANVVDSVGAKRKHESI